MTQRLDQALVARGVVRSRSRARRLVLDGHVRVDGQVSTRPAMQVRADQQVHVDHELARLVGRGAEKLVGAIDATGLQVGGAVALDLGASTGGFTQVLVDRGVRMVYAVDVGHGQLAEALTGDPRVVSLERTHVKDLGPDIIGHPCDVVVVDVSFISLTHVVGPLATVSAAHAEALMLVKPQFEVGQEHLDGTGVVRSAQARAGAIERVVTASVDAGWIPLAVLRSAITGSHGNHEYFLHLTRDPTATPRGLAALTAVVGDDEC